MPVRSNTSRRARRSFRSRRITYRRALRIRRNPRVNRRQKYVSIGRTLGAFPNRKRVVLRYVENITLDGGASTTDHYVFRVNSLNDPNYTGTGHQPMFHDLYSQIYEKYKVNYATIRVVALNTHITNTAFSNQLAGTTSSDTQYYAANERAVRLWLLRDTSTSDYPSNLDSLVEEGSKNFKWRYCPQTTSGRMPSVKMACTPHKLLGVSKYDNTLNANTSNNPDAEAYFIVGAQGLGDGNNPDSMKFQVIMTFNVTYYELKKNQAQN